MRTYILCLLALLTISACDNSTKKSNTSRKEKTENVDTKDNSVSEYLYSKRKQKVATTIESDTISVTEDNSEEQLLANTDSIQAPEEPVVTTSVTDPQPQRQNRTTARTDPQPQRTSQTTSNTDRTANTATDEDDTLFGSRRESGSSEENSTSGYSDDFIDSVGGSSSSTGSSNSSQTNDDDDFIDSIAN